MMTQYTHTITKEEISLLEIEEFPGRILVIDTEKDADKAVSYLTQFEAVGFDTETRPSFKKGTRYKLSSVSYTHLDVYKRQILRNRPIRCQRFIFIIRT